MDFERAFDTLGLAPGASEQDIEWAYRRLCDDFDARIGRVTSLALRDRYAAARAELDGARAIAVQAAKLQRASRANGEHPTARAWEVLGLAPGASPLEVASAYVSLCEELDREVAAAPTEALRKRCLEARAEIDSAYQHCAAAPLAGDASGPIHASAGYATQVARATFEAPVAEPPALNPALIQILADDDPPVRRSRSRRSPLRRVGVAAALLLFTVAGSLGYVWWSDPEQWAFIVRYLPLPPDPELVEAQTSAEYLRRRVAEERRDIQRRSEEADERLAGLQTEASGANGTAEERALAAGALEQAQARSALAKRLFELTERHIFSSSALAEAYGHMELATELAGAGATDRAVSAYSEARADLEATLANLDQAESALGARYEAVDARDAWVALAASAGLEPGDAVLEGGQRLVAADGLLEAGNFAGAIPDLRQASQSFRTAFDEGRRELATRRAAFEVERKTAEAERIARAASERNADALPPVSASNRADVKLVAIPAGSFLYGCNGEAGRECPSSETTGQRAELAAFQIDRTEVRVSEYRHCVDEGACAVPAVANGCNWNAPGRGEHPVNCVDWDQARAYCEWIGKRLPTEQEWEKAARGTDGRTYPWGDDGPSCDVAVMSGAPSCAAGTAPVASRDRGRSPYGLFDMAGNVFEWTGSLYASGGEARVLRGGSWKNDATAIRSSHREGALPNLRDASVGFRCAQGSIVADTRAR
jgi:formylglycine-generating enzyme required for sulfatase activity